MGKAGGDAPRPLLLGIKNLDSANEVITAANELKNKGDPWDKMSIVRDLTAMQRDEESKMYKEVDELAKKLSEEDAKKYEWKVVRPRGRKHVVKALKAQETEGAAAVPPRAHPASGYRGAGRLRTRANNVNLRTVLN